MEFGVATSERASLADGNASEHITLRPAIAAAALAIV
jgi:hypothetical protein